MLDIKLLLGNISFYIDKIKIRDKNFNYKNLFKIYFIYKNFLYRLQLMRNKRNFFSKKILIYKNNLIHIKYLKYFVKLINFNISFLKKKINIFNSILNNILLYIPNIPDNDVPKGTSDHDNKIIYKWGNIKKYSYKIIDHINFGILSKNIDFTTSTIISGSSFVIMKNDIALLYRAISQFMLNTHIKSNYSEIYVPYIVNDFCLYGTGQLPKFKKDIFYIFNNNDKKLALIPTSEVSLINLYRDKILKEKKLPIKLVSNTPCFRNESKSYGKNNRGLIRLNQFDKVELIQIVKPQFSNLVLENLTLDAEKILRKLELPYRKVLLCIGSMGFSSSKTYDLELWSPITNSYIEVSSCSNTLDFQSRRINLRYKDINLNKNIFLHILNGSGLAIGRVLVGIIENCQIKTGVVKIPKVLIKYMNKKKYIKCI